MKKIIAIAAGLAVLLSLTACVPTAKDSYTVGSGLTPNENVEHDFVQIHNDTVAELESEPQYQFVTDVNIDGSAGKDRTPHVTMHVDAIYEGWGIDGEFLGSSTSSYTLNVFAGDELYEWNGHFHKSRPDAKAEVIAVIKALDDNSVTIEVEGETLEIGYDSQNTMWSLYMSPDAENYRYDYSFSKSE